MQDEEHVLVTSSSDRTIRIWWKGRSHRCLKGHNGPVTTLVDTLLGNCESKVLASGGEDCTVRLWSVGGKHHPIVTFHGHAKPVSLLSAAKHKASLLVSMSTDSRLRVWDTTLASSSGSSSCVGTVGFPGTPAGMECHETLCYVAAGSSVAAIDIRTMQKVCTIAVHPPKIRSFKMLPSKWLMCTGGEEKALLWDMRKNQAKPNPNAVAELEHGSLVNMLHMDSYKVVTGGPLDYHPNIWETDTGLLANQLDCRFPGETQNYDGLSAMGVYGSCIVTSGCYEEQGVLCFRDFSNCSVSLSSPDEDRSLKFWEPRNSSDSEDVDSEFENLNGYLS
ncbi:katanin p80 WD40 repeat-containing subunit B1-like isoform X2 [Asparagus officinalis]|nr:katanin p80 WD40 repeat-containing subunit B1-like isoform X2 [Asparagus officinalis]XP_020250261.1 katanin p80 WD40 repeat-containing subunit B1-like isoform X2 [Asparagus officinalis]